MQKKCSFPGKKQLIQDKATWVPAQMKLLLTANNGVLVKRQFNSLYSDHRCERCAAEAESCYGSTVVFEIRRKSYPIPGLHILYVNRNCL